VYKRIAFLAIMLITACSPVPVGPPATAAPGSTRTETPGVTTSIPTTLTPAPPSDNSACYYNWARQRLPELSEQVQAAVQQVQPGAQAYAEAYGEDCLDQQGESVSFSAMETDFHLTLSVTDLSDQNELGGLLDQALTALDEFPPGQTPGPQSGYIGITFQADGDESRLWFQVRQADDLRQGGLHGAELLTALTNNP
jgi:hypothetical protein